MNRAMRRHTARSVSLSGLGASALAMVLAVPLGARAGGSVPSSELAAAALTDRLIIKYRAGLAGVALTDAGAERASLHRGAQDAAARSGLRLNWLKVSANNVHVMKLERRLTHADVQRLALDIMANDAGVDYAEPDRLLQPALTPTDTQYGQQWHYFEPTGGLNLPPAWDKSTGSGVVVAVLDTGYRPHADLAANLLPGYDFIADTIVANDGGGRDSSALDPGDAVVAGECGIGVPAQDQSSSWHGTHVAGTIAALSNNASGVAGVAFGAKVLPVRVLGKCGGFTSDIAAAVIWASGGSVPGVPANTTPARVINLSLGGSGACDATSH